MDNMNLEERAVASAVASLSSLNNSNNKRARDDSPDAAGGMVNKVARRMEPAVEVAGPALPPAAEEQTQDAPAPIPETSTVLKPYPFFHYNDFSTEKDPDSLTPLTPPGRVPNFPAKMHSILSRPDLADVICWMPHGRSWRVLKPREFEIRVIPTYFEHAKFSSFIRQANGWGFRRITQGRDRNSYYHERFLRGLPHLCKKMKRPGVSEKQAADPDLEPDLYKVSELHPVPERAQDDSILLHCTLQGGPKARMPIYSGALKTLSADECVYSTTKDIKMPTIASLSTAQGSTKLTPHDTQVLDSFQKSLGASESETSGSKKSTAVLAPSTVAPSQQIDPFSIGAMPFMQPPMFPHASTFGYPNLTAADKMNPLAAANQMAFTNPAAAWTASTAASQFAAGFVAAAALNQQHLRSLMFGATMNGANYGTVVPPHSG